MSEAEDLFREAYVKVGELGARRRQELGLSSMNFALAVGVSVARLSNFEHGHDDTPEYDMGLIEDGLMWQRGAVDRVITEVQAGRIRVDRIFMEHLDREGPAGEWGLLRV